MSIRIGMLSAHPSLAGDKRACDPCVGDADVGEHGEGGVFDCSLQGSVMTSVNETRDDHPLLPRASANSGHSLVWHWVFTFVQMGSLPLSRLFRVWQGSSLSGRTQVEVTACDSSRGPETWW